MRRALRRAGLALAGLVLGLAAALVLTARPADPALWPPPPDATPVTVHLVSHGWHSGLVLPQDALLAAAGRAGAPGVAAIARRFQAYGALEIGWGEERFYRAPVPPGRSFDPWLAARALLRPGNGSVLHVVGVDRDPVEVFSASTVVPVTLSPAGLERLAASLERSVAAGEGGPRELGPGLYGPSLFYAAEGRFGLLSVCNHWTARQLAAAGLPHAPLLAILPRGMLLDLSWRAGLTPAPRPSFAGR